MKFRRGDRVIEKGNGKRWWVARVLAANAVYGAMLLCREMDLTACVPGRETCFSADKVECEE